jgi:hypothetical protein
MAEDALAFWIVLNMIVMGFLAVCAYFMGKIKGSIETHQLYDKKMQEIKEEMDKWIADLEKKQKQRAEEEQAAKKRRRKK